MLRQCIEWLESGEKTSTDLVALCQERIAEREPELRAWVEVAPQDGHGNGPLSGIPFGAKDTYETRGLATEFGSPIYAGRKGQTDAALVTQLRTRGAILMGKTQTTAFACFDPAPTRNPYDLRHTPGGSSSGSAAAVACGMVPFALGSQTQGSVLRPASCCGVCGFKPTYGLLSLEGLLPFAPSLDTPGLFTQNAADMRLLWNRMGFPAEAGSTRTAAASVSLDAEPEMEAAFRRTVDRLRAGGFRIEAIEFPPGWPDLLAASRLVNQYEGARTHEALWRQYGAAMGAKLAQLIADGLQTSENEYRRFLKRPESAVFLGSATWNSTPRERSRLKTVVSSVQRSDSEVKPGYGFRSFRSKVGTREPWCSLAFIENVPRGEFPKQLTIPRESEGNKTRLDRLSRGAWIEFAITAVVLTPCTKKQQGCLRVTDYSYTGPV